MKRLVWLLLLVPSASALGVDVRLEPADIEVGLTPSLTEPTDPHARVCAAGTCLLDSETTPEATRTVRATPTTQEAPQDVQVERAGHGLSPWTAAAPAAGLLALLARMYWLGPGRIMTVLAGPGRLFGIGLLARWTWPEGPENETRRAILDHITAHPGASIQDARQAADIAWGTAVYHLQRMERDGTLVSVRSGNHHRYWRSGSPEAGLRHAWAVLEQPTTARIAAAVHEQPGIHQTGLCEELRVKTPTASKHLKRLVTSGLVMSKRCSRFTLYAPTERLEQVMQLRAARA